MTFAEPTRELHRRHSGDNGSRFDRRPEAGPRQLQRSWGSGVPRDVRNAVAGSTRLDVVFPSKMRYRVELYPSEEGFAVSCPRLPGCWSQGTTEAEALDNIRVAIQEYLAAQVPGLNQERLDHDSGSQSPIVRYLERKLAIPNPFCH